MDRAHRAGGERPVAETVRTGEARGRWVLLATVLGSGIASLDATVVNIALPTIGTSLGSGLSGLQWTLNGYTLTLASFILLGGSLGDVFGRRRVFVLGAVGFALASILCALAPSVGLLVGARMLQGVAGALLTPGSLAIIAASFHEDDRAAAIGAWSGFSGLAGAAGPFVGGYLIEALSWRFIFLINVPLVVVVVIVALRHVPESHDPHAQRTLDVGGAVTGAATLAALTYGLIGLGGNGSTVVAVVCLVGSVVGAGAFVTLERRSRHPMLPLDVFRSHRFTGANLVTLVVYAALSGVFFLLVLQLQIVSGFSPLASGAALLPVTALMLVGSARVGGAASRLGPRPFMTVGPMVSAVGLLMLLRVGTAASYWTQVLPAVVVFGLGLTLTVAPLTAAVLMAAPPERAGVASGVNNAVARTAGLVAVAVLPWAAGLGEQSFRNPAVFDQGFDRAIVGCAGLLVLGGVLAAAFVGGRTPVRSERQPANPCFQCGVDGPRLSPDEVPADHQHS